MARSRLTASRRWRRMNRGSASATRTPRPTAIVSSSGPAAGPAAAGISAANARAEATASPGATLRIHREGRLADRRPGAHHEHQQHEEADDRDREGDEWGLSSGSSRWATARSSSATATAASTYQARRTARRSQSRRRAASPPAARRAPGRAPRRGCRVRGDEPAPRTASACPGTRGSRASASGCHSRRAGGRRPRGSASGGSARRAGPTATMRIRAAMAIAARLRGQ